MMGLPVLKAFVLCDEITSSAGGTGQIDIRGAGLDQFRGADVYPQKHSFWAYVELTDVKPEGILQLAVMRADSGRRHYFREIVVKTSDRLAGLRIGIRLFNLEFPTPGIYFVELWYDGSWILDQRIEVLEFGGE